MTHAKQPLKDKKNLSLDILKWRSRRGMLELDLLLISFIDNNYELLSQEQLLEYYYLLEQEDTDIYSWFIEDVKVPDERLHAIFKLIKEYKSLK
tara:strand:+ start:10872 stop:11153 length:282 start_codon:yes stop_codon:yes gene_type:complete